MQELLDFLEANSIEYDVFEHDAVFTVEESKDMKINIPGNHSKNLFLKNKKGDQYYLVSVEASKKVDLKLLKEQLGESKLSFGSPEKMEEYLGLAPGSVSPFGLINDKDNKVNFILDKNLSESEIVNFHPNINTATLSLKQAEFKKYLDLVNPNYRIIEI